MFDIISQTDLTVDGQYGRETKRLVFNPGDNLLYEVGLELADGQPVLRWKPYPVQLTAVDGLPVPSSPPEDVPEGRFDKWTMEHGPTYSMNVAVVDGTKVIQWQ